MASQKQTKKCKHYEKLMKSLSNFPTVEQQLTEACNKFLEMSEENKSLQLRIKQTEKREEMLIKEKDQLQKEYHRSALAKSKLEDLCRELQKQNKSIKEEALTKIRAEEERQKETQAKFQTTLSEITALLDQNNKKNIKLRDDNLNMVEKFKSVVQHYQLRDEQADKMAKQIFLETQLSEAKLQKASLEHQAEKERLIVDIEQLKATCEQAKIKISEQQSAEKMLKGQLAIYMEKYDEFQDALTNSTKAFSTFKVQIDTMSNRIRTLEKESHTYKSRWEKCQATLVTNEERNQRQQLQLQSLCRALQAERSVLANTLKEHNIERPPMPAPASPPPAPAPAPSFSKAEAVEASCAQLRQSLAHLQGQLTALTGTNANANGTSEEPAPDKPKKKSKAKKKKGKAGELIVAEGETMDKDAIQNLIQAIGSANISLHSPPASEPGATLNGTCAGEVSPEVAQEAAAKVEAEMAAEPEGKARDMSLVADANPDEEALHVAEVKPIVATET